jgi:hypothetical protein
MAHAVSPRLGLETPISQEDGADLQLMRPFQAFIEKLGLVELEISIAPEGPYLVLNSTAGYTGQVQLQFASQVVFYFMFYTFCRITAME